MSTGLLDQRIRLFRFSDTSSNGYASSGYAYDRECWGRLDAPSAREATVANQGEHVVDAVLTVQRGIPILPGALVKGEDGKYYKVTGVPPSSRMMSRQRAFATFVDDSSFSVTGEPE